MQEQQSRDQFRRSGRTTRIIDEAVQTIFKDGVVTLKDHPTASGVPQPAQTPLKFLLDRLYNEHNRRGKKVQDVDECDEENMSPLYAYWDTKCRVRIKKRSARLSPPDLPKAP